VARRGGLIPERAHHVPALSPTGEGE
jgi:hypothetical protein